jgi:hypothetical protein
VDASRSEKKLNTRIKDEFEDGNEDEDFICAHEQLSRRIKFQRRRMGGWEFFAGHRDLFSGDGLPRIARNGARGVIPLKRCRHPD